jgi:hypothetical protein
LLLVAWEPSFPRFRNSENVEVLVKGAVISMFREFSKRRSMA